MPDKLRKDGHKVVKHNRVPATLEEKVKAWYNAERRHASWWNGDRGGWPNIWMTMAQKFEIPIAQVKNIVGYQGITDRPLPAPLTPEEHRVRQEHKGELMAEDVRDRHAWEFKWLLWKQEKGIE